MTCYHILVARTWVYYTRFKGYHLFLLRTTWARAVQKSNILVCLVLKPFILAEKLSKILLLSNPRYWLELMDRRENSMKLSFIMLGISEADIYRYSLSSYWLAETRQGTTKVLSFIVNAKAQCTSYVLTCVVVCFLWVIKYCSSVRVIETWKSYIQHLIRWDGNGCWLVNTDLEN